MATDHDSIDHGYAAKAHPSIHLDTARLSWQEPRGKKPPTPWKIGLVVALVLVVLFVLERLQSWRVEIHMAHMESEIRGNIVVLAHAALDYMNAHNVQQVTEEQLVGPDGPLKVAPAPILGESYHNLVFTRGSTFPAVVEVHVPSHPNLFFHISWKHPDAPDFVSQPVPDPGD